MNDEETQNSTRTANQSIKAHCGLRGIAASNVAVAHLGLTSMFPNSRIIAFILPVFLWQNECVDLFFILSGFILNFVYLRVGKVHWASYAIARLARIAPLYYLTLFFLLALDFYSFAFHGILDDHWTFIVLMKNLLLVSGLWGNVTATSLNLPSWSVSVEVLLYASAFPMLCVASKWIGRRDVGGIFSAVCLAVLAGCYLCPPLKPSYPVCRGIVGFTMGFICCSLWRQHGKDTFTNRTVCVLASGSAILSIVKILPRELLIPCFPVIVFLTAGDAGIVSRVLGCPILLWLGERSYSIYLWHYPMGVFFSRLLIYGHAEANGHYPLIRLVSTCVLQVLFTVIIADLCYRFYECPARDLIRRWFMRIPPQQLNGYG